MTPEAIIDNRQRNTLTLPRDATPAPASDFALAQRAAQGDVQAFEELFRQHRRLVYGLCLRMTQDVVEAEGVAQEGFVLLFRKIGGFRGEANFTTWLHRLTVNQVLMRFRKNKSRREEALEDENLQAHE